MFTVVNGCLIQAVLKNEVDVMLHQANIHINKPASHLQGF